MPKTIVQGREPSTVDGNGPEVSCTGCGMVPASKVDHEPGWCKTDFAASGVDGS